MQEYTKTDQFIHQLCQTLAKFGRTFAEASEDDSHTNNRFDFIGKQIWGRWASIDKGSLILNLDLESQKFNLLNQDYNELASFETIGKTQDQVEQTIAGYLTQDLIGKEVDFLKELHFEIPAYKFKDKAIQKWNTAGLHQWMNYRHQANQACNLLLNHLNVEAEIRIWPHHFDTGIYAELFNNIGIGFGWAMADSMIDDAYFYYSVYGLNGHTIDYASVKPLSTGQWITGEHWNGAVLSLKEAKEPNIHRFLKETTEWALS